ncbi:MAG TPA: hypothetical protein VFE78_03760 [Gemmataceae bacterium]|nr:hypothetical protein [Gemmataceae bacterium]
MKRALPRLVSYAAAGVALFLISGVFAPWWLGSDRSLASAGSLLLREMQRGEALSSRDEAVRRCLTAKTRITAEVVAGRLGLTEAAAAFQEWNETVKDGNEHWVGVYRTAEDEEAVCRNVIVWAANATERDPERRDAVVGRLEEELRQFLRSRAAGGL